MGDLLKELPNGGAVVALIATVVLFLRKQSEDAERLKAITADFSATMRQVSEATQGQIRLMLEDHLAAVRALEATVSELTAAVRVGHVRSSK